jgi:hypothetical protein
MGHPKFHRPYTELIPVTVLVGWLANRSETLRYSKSRNDIILKVFGELQGELDSEILATEAAAEAEDDTLPPKRKMKVLPQPKMERTGARSPRS